MKKIEQMQQASLPLTATDLKLGPHSRASANLQQTETKPD